MASSYEKDLRKKLQKEIPVANKRLKNLAKSDWRYASNAYRYLTEKLSNQGFYLNEKNGAVQFKPQSKFKSIQDIQKFTGVLEKFLSASTSSVKGTKSAYKKSYETFLAKHDISKKELSAKDFAALVSSNDWEKSKQAFTSDRIISVVKKYGVEAAINSMSEWKSIDSVEEFENFARKAFESTKQKNRRK